MKIKLTEITETTEITEITGITEITEETIFDDVTDETECCDSEEFETPLDGGYREWKERRKREKLYGADGGEVNLAEELVYLHLPDAETSCALLL